MSMNVLWEEVAVVLDVKINMEVLLAVVPMVLSEQEMDIASEEDLDSNREFPATVIRWWIWRFWWLPTSN